MFIVIIIGLLFLSLFSIISWANSSNCNIWTYKEDVRNIKNDIKKYKINKSDEITFLGHYGKKPIFIKNDVKHIFICGTTGSGKTVTISNFLETIFNYDYPALIVDGKGDTSNGSLLDYIEKYKKLYPNKKVYIINLNNPKNCDKYNPFLKKEPTVIKDMLINMTDWSEEHYKINTSRYIQKLIYLMQENELSVTMENVIKHLSIEAFKNLSLELQKKK